MHLVVTSKETSVKIKEICIEKRTCKMNSIFLFWNGKLF